MIVSGRTACKRALCKIKTEKYDNAEQKIDDDLTHAF